MKKIGIDQLGPGMFVRDLNVDWMARPFLRQSFVVQEDAAVSKIRAAGIRNPYVDTSRGIDVPGAPTEAEVQRSVEPKMPKVAAETPPAPLMTSAAQEMSRATKICDAAGNAVRHVMLETGRAMGCGPAPLPVMPCRAIAQAFR